MIYPVVVARVTAHVPPRGVQVVYKTTGQSMPAGPAVTILVPYADALRVKQFPLPGIGTWGVVAFPYGDIRNGVWLGAYLPSLQDALTTTGDATDPFIDYQAHFSGDWQLLDGKGNQAHQWADGSFMVMGTASGLPKPVRHIVDDANNQKAVEFTRADRIPSPPSAYNFNFQHQSGTSVHVDPAGNVTVSGAAGASLTFDFGMAAITFGASGQATINLKAGQQLTITQGGASASDFLVLVSKFIAQFNVHTHSGGGTGPPNTLLSANDVKSAVIDINA